MNYLKPWAQAVADKATAWMRASHVKSKSHRGNNGMILKE
jgi:hypothetical protein